MTTTQLVDFTDAFTRDMGFTFRGAQVGGASVSFIYDRSRPGEGPKLHRHPYDELWLVEEGTVTFTASASPIEAVEGDVVVVAAGTPHKFVNTGDVALRMVCIHTAPQMQTEWLDDPDATPEGGAAT